MSSNMSTFRIMENNKSNWHSTGVDYQIPQTLHFWLFLISDVPAFLCNTFVFYHLLADRQLRNALHNHVPIVILFLAVTYELIDIPLHLQFLSTGIVSPSIPATCLIWWLTDWGSYYAIAVLLIFGSIERHILIFHSHLVATKRKRLIFHYIPLLVITLSITMFYCVAILAPICESTFDYTADICGVHACYGTIPVFAAIEQMVFSAASSCLITVFNMALLIRVIRQKYRIHRCVRWPKQRKLALQMIALSLLYLIFSLPLTIVYIVRLYDLPDWADEVEPALYFLGYYAVLLLPYVCLGNLPDLSKKLKNFIPRQRWQVATVVPLS